MTAFDDAYDKVKKLAEQFQGNLAFFTRPEYQEAEARIHFINPFFEALGWDVRSIEHPNPYEQEVRVEKSQKQQQSKAQKRADYAFYLTPNYKDPKFFVEAKKPAVDLKHPDNYFQTIRYGWNAGTPIAVLTDFEQFHIIDCRFKPDIRYALSGRHKEYQYTDFLDKEKFAEIYWLFSREAVLSNSLQKYSDSLPKPKGKAAPKEAFVPIDDSFLEYIDGIREDLAKAFKKNDESLDSLALTEVVTRTIDRLVFIRFLEDKLIEPVNHVSEWRSWKDFIVDCRKLDVKYNGVVFKEHPILDKKGFSGAEEKIFLEICADMGSLNSPYDFNYIPIHILGSIYERFLGKVVVATEHRARIEEKPEVRKAGGVYYTPKYIVDYIVQHTIHECIRDKTPKQIADLRFADIACGSGSFLIGVYEFLLDYHKLFYQNKYAERTEPIDARNEDFGNVEYKDKQWVLTLKLKQDILLNNIYGVDIDRQAVEVTQLSLFLKMLEEETTGTTQVKQGALFSKVLPDLSRNIVCGNSLVGTDVRSGQLSFGITLQEEMKLNPMDYEVAFPSILKNGGFDAIVGNPPYIRIQTIIESSPLQAGYLSANYKSASKGNYDIYVVFVEKAYSLLKQNGKLGYILPHKFFTAAYGAGLLELLLSKKAVDHIVHFGHQQIFKDATTYTCILILQNKKSKKVFGFSRVDDLQYWIESDKSIGDNISYDSLDSTDWNFISGTDAILFNKLAAINTTLELSTKRIFQGFKTGADKVFILEYVNETNSAYIAFSSQLDRNINIEKSILKPLIKGGDSLGYVFNKPKLLIIFPYKKSGDTVQLMSEDVLKSECPLAYDYLKQCKQLLLKRDGGKIKLRDWYSFSRNQALDIMSSPKIFTPDISPSASYSLDEKGNISFTGGVAGGYGIVPNDNMPIQYLLGLLNSRLLDWYLKKVSTQMRGGWYSFEAKYIKNLPIIQATKENKSIQDQISSLVNQAILGKNQLQKATTESEKSFLQNKCNSLQMQIDKLVYQLYDVSAEEIKLVDQ